MDNLSAVITLVLNILLDLEDALAIQNSTCKLGISDASAELLNLQAIPQVASCVYG